MNQSKKIPVVGKKIEELSNRKGILRNNYIWLETWKGIGLLKIRVYPLVGGF